MKKVIVFLLFLSCRSENGITSYSKLVFKMSEMRGQAQILSNFKNEIPPKQYEIKAKSIDSTMQSIFRESQTLKLDTKDKKFIDDEILKITHLLQN